jgi:outer membrane protein
MRTGLFAAGYAAIAMSFTLHAPLSAQEAGDFQVKLFGTMVDPDGAIDDVELDAIGLPAGTDTRADTNYVPTIAAEYFVSPNISLETICCVTQHDVVGTGPLAGAGLVANANIVPATISVKFHPLPNAAIRPYVGVGPTYFIFIDEQPGAATRALGATRQHLSDELGFALQAGVDIPLGERFGLSIDAKRYFVSTTARWFAGNTEVLRTRHELDPWVVSAGVSFRF